MLALPDNKGSCSFGYIWKHARVDEARAALDRVEAPRTGFLMVRQDCTGRVQPCRHELYNI